VSDFDLSEVQALSASIAATTGRLASEARSAVAKGALNIKTETRQNISDHPTWKRLAAAVNYDMAGNAAYSTATIGYDDVGQGELAGIAEFGSVKHDPHPALIPALKAEAPRFEKAMGDIASKVMGAL